MADEESGFTFVDKRHSGESAATQEVSQEAVPTEFPSPLEDFTGSDEESGSDDAYGSEIPEVFAILDYSIRLLATSAWHNLGLLANPKTGEAKSNLTDAKIAIDAVSDLVTRLEAAPDDVVPTNARRELKNLVNDLRLNYVSQRDQSTKLSS